MKKIALDGETADKITVLNLKDYLKYLRKELKDHKKKGEYMHPDDVAETMKLIPALELIIKNFGGDCD